MEQYQRIDQTAKMLKISYIFAIKYCVVYRESENVPRLMPKQKKEENPGKGLGDFSLDIVGFRKMLINIELS